MMYDGTPPAPPGFYPVNWTPPAPHQMINIRVIRATKRQIWQNRLQEFREHPSKALLISLQDGMADLTRMDNQIVSSLPPGDPSLEDEVVECDNLWQQWCEARAAWETTQQCQNSVPQQQSQSPSHVERRRPKIEFRQFDGDPRKYIAFWSQFQKYHDDTSLSAEDKFEYLISATKEDSAARQFLDRFPLNAATYETALNGFKERFGNQKRLKQLYVRELVSIVVSREVDISEMHDKVHSQLCALESLGVTKDQLNTLLFPLVEMGLPSEVLTAWERYEATGKADDTVDDMERLLRFMSMESERVRVHEERANLYNKAFVHKVPSGASLVSTSLTQRQEPKKPDCIFCAKGHPSERCFTAKRLPYAEVKQILLKNKRCLKCMSASHFLNDCNYKKQCPRCSAIHHVFCCPQPFVPKAQRESASADPPNPDKAVNCHVNANKECVYLQTLLVEVQAGDGSKGSCKGRALLDTGSQNSYITTDFAHKLNLPVVGRVNIRQSVFGGGELPTKVHDLIDLILVGSRSYQLQVRAIATNTICNDIPKADRELSSELKDLSGYYLSDVNAKNTNVDLLLGADCLGKILTGNVITLPSGPVAVETHLGWTIMGRKDAAPVDSASFTTLTMQHSVSLNVMSLWELESIGITDPTGTPSKADIDAQAVDQFNSTVRKVDGRYEVTLPFANGHPELPSLREMAQKRLQSVTEKLRKQGLLQVYDSVFQEWLQAGIVECAPPLRPGGTVHYLPHHPVVKLTSETTRVRPVFDGSAKTHPRGSSLNDCLLPGPNLIEKIPSVLLRFRRGKFGVTADIRKAFLQISVRPEDRDWLRFLWWDDNGDLLELRHCRVVFGLSPSPYHLAATLAHHLEGVDSEDPYYETATRLKTAFYVDDAASSFETQGELEKFKHEASEVMAQGMFELTQWRETGEPGTATLLGVAWDTEKDVLSCPAPIPKDPDGALTKRRLLSTAQSVFDPIGFLVPNLIIIKMLIQEVWKLEKSWDEELPSDIQRQYATWAAGLNTLSLIKIPRSLGLGDQPLAKRQVHVFCDASGQAYATCIFLRSEWQEQVEVQLVMAKARVAPLTKITIPRLELLGCLIGSRLYASIPDLRELPLYCWTDSAIVMAWLARPSDWNNFVSNRVKEILKHTPFKVWRHVPGTENPADLPSRGCSAEELAHGEWWLGPDWLKNPENTWPNVEYLPAEDADLERKKTKVLLATIPVEDEPEYFRYFSSFSKTVRMIGWIYRFYKRARTGGADYGPLSADELQWAETRLLRNVQKSLSEKDVEGMVLYTNEKELLCTKSRVTDVDGDVQYLVVLPGTHILVQRMIWEEHIKNAHVGVLTLLTLLRGRYWITRGRQAVKKVLRGCLRCRRYTAKAARPPASALPIERTDTTGKCFTTCGVDCFGPLHTRDTGKVWGVIFTCGVYRAVHLEIVQSMTTESFLLAMRRFIARRGRVMNVYSDNGLNFVGTANQLEAISGIESALKLKWIRNPPTGSWYGGFFERLIRCIKGVLRMVLGGACLSLEELETVICDAEAFVNSRPLTYVSENCNELQALTPAMYLQDNAVTLVDDLDAVDRASLCKRAQHRIQVCEALRKRFKEEYLPLLIQRVRDEVNPICEGSIVLIGSDDTKRVSWPIGRVMELFPGRDGECRVARVRTGKGECIRPINRLYILELGDIGSQVTSESSEVLSELPNEILESNVSSKMTDDVVVVEHRSRSGRVVKRPRILDL